MSKAIVLVGPMGAGKTTIGRQIAKLLDRTFYDSDKEIEKRTGASIPLIFELESESGFRKRETAMIKELMTKENIVLATGGGAVLNKKNRKLMSDDGLVVYLCAPIDQLVRRTAKDKNRPLLQTGNPKKTLQDLLDVRDPLYREVADIIFETNGFTVRQVATRLVKQLKTKV